MTDDAFAHLPHLRGRLTPPERSALRVTAEVLAQWDQRALQMGQPHGWRLCDRTLEETRRAMLGDCGCGSGEGLWVFSYGSLMWDPGFHFAEVRLADLEGYQRRFSFKSRLGRGSPEQPALMLSIEPREGRCQGLAFHIPAEVAQHESGFLWRREMLRGSYRPLLLPVRTPQGEVRALVFASNPAHPDHVAEQPIEEVAAIIARARGVLGSNRQYLEHLAGQLDCLGIRDPYTSELLAQVQRLPAVDG